MKFEGGLLESLPEEEKILENNDSNIGKKPIDGLLEVAKEAGMEAKIIKIENGGEFPEAIIFKKEKIPSEKLVRLYRGIVCLDDSLLNQVPYTMRIENESGKPTIIENIRQESETLANNPTYENLLTYVNKVSFSLSEKENQRMDKDLTDIEDDLLKGYSLRKSLIFGQAKHGVSWGEGGINPYISATYNPFVAACYGKRGGVIVIDVPISKIEDFNADTLDEVNIKGSLDKEYITAVLPSAHLGYRGRKGISQEEIIEKEINIAIGKVNESINVPLYNDEELKRERKNKIENQIEVDKQQWGKDIKVLKGKRALESK